LTAKDDTGKFITLKTPAEIQVMYEANQIVAQTLKMLEEEITPGQSTLQLDRLAEEFARDHGAEPAFKGYHGFPGSLCVSLNEQVVHGIPSRKTILKEGDIISIDFGVRYKGFYGDSAVTLAVGRIDKVHENFIEVARQALYKGIEQARVGNRINNISAAVQNYAEKHGFSVVRQFVGHGIGTQLHEGPEIPNYATSGSSPRIQSGMVLAIEPMINLGSYDVRVLKDGWTVVTCDRKYSAHFEHSVAVTDDGPRILSQLA
jgi:methionyl aminopeptidase